MATVYFGGLRVFHTTGLVATDDGKLLYLSAVTAGKATKTPPSADNTSVQVIARIVEVSGTARVQLVLDERYIRILSAAYGDPVGTTKALRFNFSGKAVFGLPGGM